jgi:CXXX repeat modification system protein
MKEVVGKVTVEEMEEIKSLFERKNGLIELFRISDGLNENLYQKLVKDMGETSTKFQQWWDSKSEAYKWNKKEGSNWEINFNTCEVYLVSSAV